MNVLWAGKLEKGGVKFNAEIVEYNNRITIIERNGLEINEISVHLINPEGLLNIIHEMSKK